MYYVDWQLLGLMLALMRLHLNCIRKIAPVKRVLRFLHQQGTKVNTARAKTFLFALAVSGPGQFSENIAPAGRAPRG